MRSRANGVIFLAAAGVLAVVARTVVADDFALPSPREVLADLPGQARAGRVVSVLSRIRALKTSEVGCGLLSICPPNLMYYDKAAVDACVAEALTQAPKAIQSGDLDAAARVLRDIKAATLYGSNRMAPIRTPLYLYIDVVNDVDEALAVIAR